MIELIRPGTNIILQVNIIRCVVGFFIRSLPIRKFYIVFKKLYIHKYIIINF